MRAIPVPATAEAFLARTFGEEGRQWLATVPVLTEQLAAEWELTLGPPLRGGLLAVVREATTADGLRAVLKLASRWDRPADEIACLEAWAGGAAPRLLRSDLDRGALLLERIEPGRAARHADAATVAQALRQLHCTPPEGMRRLADLARRRIARAFEQGRAKPYQVTWGLAAIERLEADPVEPALLHGDCDWRNLLSCDRRGIAAIDPLPCVGDPAYDAGYWAQAAGDPGRRNRTTEIADALGLDIARVRGWCAVVAIHG